MKFKDDRIRGEIYVVGEDLFAAVRNLDKGFVYTDEDAADSAISYPEKIYRVEVTIFEA